MPAVNGRLDGAQHWWLATEVRDDLRHHHAEPDIAVLQGAPKHGHSGGPRWSRGGGISISLAPTHGRYTYQLTDRIEY
jgi:hypothetical protein